MTNFLGWPALVGAVVIYYITTLFYRLFLHPLARFPGPRLAAISRWYEGYYDVVLGGQYTRRIAQMHRSYGPIIRISPYELHVSDPDFYETLYRNDGRWHKYAWASDAFGAQTSTIFGADHDAHKMRRRAVATYFSKPKVASRESEIHEYAEKLSQRISHFSHAKEAFDLGAAMSAFTRDNASAFVTGKDYRALDMEDFGVAFSEQNQGAGVFWRTTKHVRWFGPLLRSIPATWIKDKDVRSFLDFLKESEADTNEKLRAATASDGKTPPTMIDAIYHSTLPATEKYPKRVFEEVATVTGAAFETTGSALRLILYHIYSKPSILQRLRAELQQIRNPAPLKDLEQLPYLTATITEGLRLSPAIASRAARVTDRDLAYGKWRIPAGTPVGMTTLLLHTDEKLYPAPITFDPERWLSREQTKSVYAPFGKGTRVCLGMHLAWAEMYIVLSTLIRRFDFVIKEATASDFEMIRDNFAIGTKAGCHLVVTPTKVKA